MQVCNAGQGACVVTKVLMNPVGLLSRVPEDVKDSHFCINRDWHKIFNRERAEGQKQLGER